MHYLGGKARLAKKIVAVLNTYRKTEQVYIEPFVGGINTFALMGDNKIGYDSHLDLIMLYQELLNGTLVLPDVVSEEEYQTIRKQPSSGLRGFIGFGCSFSGKWFGGYARNKRPDRNYCGNAKSSLTKKVAKCKESTFIYASYFDLTSADALVYCDPPYANTTGYSGTDKFDTVAFWEKTRELSKTNTVIISEYIAPDDFECIASFPTKTDMHTENNIRVEKLFMHKEQYVKFNST